MAPNIFPKEGCVENDNDTSDKSNKILNISGSMTNGRLNDTELSKNVIEDTYKTSSEYKMHIRWFNVFIFLYLHISAIYGLYLLYTDAKWSTYAFTHVLMTFSGFGVTAGAHRLWAHKAYKARLPLRILLMIAHTTAHQNSLYAWVRDHRIHHKFTDTDADPYNAKRGFFFSHIGWLMVHKHHLVIEKGNVIDMDDMKQDPVVMFQKKYFIPLMILFCFFLPTFIPMYFFNESFIVAFHTATLFRYVWMLNSTWSVNSAAHIWGMKPFNKISSSAENGYVAFFALGEGWHNYHHAFPWDYKTGELGKYGLNWSTAFIDFFAKIGWAYDLKTVSEEVIRNRALKTGDGSHEFCKQEKKLDNCKQNMDYNHNINSNNNDKSIDNLIWGWDDPSISIQDKLSAVILKKEKNI
uniref:CSON013525 protein n=1 Tax=Culicoides sonorensis TaxID=179676 RepID=A0A336KSV0_CULSO